MTPRALLFDVFGTCVDWRGSIVRRGAELERSWGIPRVDWFALADAWRGRYQPQMETVRSGERAWADLDQLHREALDELVLPFGLTGLDDRRRDELTRVWHQLDPWPDVATGLASLKRLAIVAPCSNGHIALQVNLARHAGLVWDAILGAEIARAYKPQPEVYLESARALGLEPNDVMFVAAHNDDLRAARALGFQTAFVPRPFEHGLEQTTDLLPTGSWDVVASDFHDIAARLS